MFPNPGQIDIGFDVVRYSAALTQIILPQPLIAVRAAYDLVDVQRLEQIDGVRDAGGRLSLDSGCQDDALPGAEGLQPLPDPALFPFLTGEVKQIVKVIQFSVISDPSVWGPMS